MTGDVLRAGFRAALLALVALAAIGAGPAAGQDLNQALGRVASAWHRGDAAAITRLAASSGISIDVDGRSVGPLAPRQAAAVLRRVFEDRESVNARGNMTRSVGGSPQRAFGEIAWTTRARGTTIPERATLFVAFVREDEGWRITEIRLIR
jgi:hypothetical protein